MKKMLSFFILTICLFSTSLFKFENFLLFDVCGDSIEKVCFVKTEEEVGISYENIKCGDKVFVSCSASVAKENLDKLLNNSAGIEFYLSGFSAQKLISETKFEEISRQNIGDLLVLTGYAPIYQDCVYIQNKKVNMQIAIRDEKIVVGFPMILTGF